MPRFRRQKSAKQKYVENQRQFAAKVNEHYENDKEDEAEDEVPANKSKPMPKPKAVRKRKATSTDQQQPTKKRSRKKPPAVASEPESENDSENESMEFGSEEQQTLGTNFMDLNDDCIRQILEYLNSDDLCALSTQCRRLRELAKDQLEHNFPNIHKRIASFEDNGYWFRYPSAEKFTICFAQFRKLSIRNALSNALSIECLKAFVKTKEKIIIEEIHFEGCRQIRPSHGKALAELFEKTTSVTFNRCKILGEFHDVILDYFPSMEKLVLWNTFEMTCPEADKTNWLKFEYPNLKNFSWFLDDEITISDEMKMFFTQNKTIEHFSLYTRSIKTLEKCTKAGIKITHIYYRITHDVKTILEYLKKLCATEKSIRLHLMFEDECRSELSGCMKLFGELKNNVRGLYFDGVEASETLAKAIGRCQHLKNLQVQYCKHIEHFAALPKLREVYMSRGIVAATSDRIRNTMFQFSTRAPKLKNLFFRNSCIEFREFEFNKINAERAKIQGATKMTFHVRTKAKERIEELSRMQLHYDMFNIKRIDLEDLANPLVTDWMYAH